MQEKKMQEEKIQFEDERYLNEQIITYIGNKRALLGNIEKEVQFCLNDMGKKKATILDLFSGSGVVARLLKQYSDTLFTNDLEEYSSVINKCYLFNREDFPLSTYDKCLRGLTRYLETNMKEGIIALNYAPRNTCDIQVGERVFYTHENAMIIDTIREYIDFYVPEHLKYFFLAPLLYEASVHNNTCGVFKGFYKKKKRFKGDNPIGQFGGEGKNSLNRILGKIELKKPILSNFSCLTQTFCEDANTLVKRLPTVDISYLDPPYNQHPYGSNYHILNTIVKNTLDTDNISNVAGIPNDFNKSNYNKKNEAYHTFKTLIENLDSKYIIISYNNEGFISYEEMVDMLQEYGTLKTTEIKYNTFRGGVSKKLNRVKQDITEHIRSKNLGEVSGFTNEEISCLIDNDYKARKDKETHTKEYLFMLKKC